MGIIVSFGVALPRICSAIYYPGQTVPSLFPVLALNSFALITRHDFTLANPPPPLQRGISVEVGKYEREGEEEQNAKEKGKKTEDTE